MMLVEMLEAAEGLPLPGREFATIEGLVLRYGRSFRPQH